MASTTGFIMHHSQEFAKLDYYIVSTLVNYNECIHGNKGTCHPDQQPVFFSCSSFLRTKNFLRDNPH